MNIIETIRAEIERRIKECEATYPKDKDGYWFPEQEEAYAIAEEYKQLLSFLSTLESEKPINLDLEKEIGSYMSNKWKFGCVIPITPVVLPNFTTEDLKDIARHFAQWGAEHLKK